MWTKHFLPPSPTESCSSSVFVSVMDSTRARSHGEMRIEIAGCGDSSLHCLFTGELFFLFLLSGLWNISISQRCQGCYGTFQSLDNGHSKKHAERKDGFMSRQGFGNELKPLPVCIFMRGSRWALTNGSTEGGWWDGSGAMKPRWFAIKYKLMERSSKILTGTRDP